jgi:hypothetical protein
MSCCEKPGISRRLLAGDRIKEHCRNCGYSAIHVPAAKGEKIAPRQSLTRRVQAYLQIRRTLSR